jgi:hypothetical protein
MGVFSTCTGSAKRPRSRKIFEAGSGRQRRPAQQFTRRTSKLFSSGIQTYCRLLFVSLCALNGVSAAADPTPQGESTAPPIDELQAAPVYFYEDSAGNLSRIAAYLEPGGTLRVERVPVSAKEIDSLEAAGFSIATLPEALLSAPSGAESSPPGGPEGATSGACPIPVNFNIAPNGSGQIVGNQIFGSTNRPPGVTTQWVDFDFFTYNYRGQPTHNPIIPFFKDTVHGWGGLIGNNSGAYDPAGTYVGCGSNALFNSQIQGWYQLPDQGPPGGPNWRSKVYNGSDSCGAEMYDGYWDPNSRYHMTVHASTGNWAAYEIKRYQDGVLVPHRPWTAIQVTRAPWPWNTDPPQPSVPPLDTSAQGLAILSIPGGSGWAIFFRNVNCGWF